MENMKKIHMALIVVLVSTLLSGCSSTTFNRTWLNPDYHSGIEKVYIVGITNQEVNRRILEDDFSQQLADHKVTGISSYKNLPKSEEIDEFKIAESIKSNGADSVLMVHVTGKHTEEFVNPGRISTYEGASHYQRPYYRNYGSYYNQRRAAIYEPATITQFDVVTVEANLYTTESKEMIWAAQLETTVDKDVQTLLKGFVKTVIKDLRKKEVI